MFSFLYSLNSQFNLYAYVTCCTLHSIKITVHQQLQICSLGILGGHTSSLLRGCCKKRTIILPFFWQIISPAILLSFLYFPSMTFYNCYTKQLFLVYDINSSSSYFLKINPTRRTPHHLIFIHLMMEISLLKNDLSTSLVLFLISLLRIRR